MRRSLLVLFTGNFISKVLGLVREGLIAALFGTGQVAGAFRIAQTGTHAPINFIAGDALNSAFIPQYKKFRAISHDKARTFIGALFVLFGGLAALLTLGLWAAAPSWTGVLAPGLDPETRSLATSMLRIMSLGIIFYLIGALLAFLAMAEDDFRPMAFRPVIQNVGIIAGAAAAFLLENPLYFAWGFTTSNVVFGSWMIAQGIQTQRLKKPSSLDLPETREVLYAFWRTLKPLLLLPFLHQGNVIVERIVATLIGLTAISALDYARFINETLIFLVSVPMAFVGLSHWSGLKRDDVRERLMKAVSLLLIISVPASVFLFTEAHTIIQVVYARGAFDDASIHMTTEVLQGMAVGLWAQVIGYVMLKALNAQMRNGVVVWVTVAALLGNVTFNLIMHPKLGALTLGLGSSLQGFVVLGGTLAALGLWRYAIHSALWMGAGVTLLAIAYQWLPHTEEHWLRLTQYGALAAVYWVVWIAAIPCLRHAIIATINRRPIMPSFAHRRR